MGAQMTEAANVEPFVEWKGEVDSLMLKNYAINTIDAGIDDDRLRSHWSSHDTPSQFVEWYAEKYDLTPLSEWGWHQSRVTP
jgi:hypothetical protein